MMTTYPHTPVLLDRCIELLSPALQSGGLVVDATLGMGGHAEALLERFDTITLLGIDRDRDALALAQSRLAVFGERAHLVHARYDELDSVLDQHFPGESPRGILLTSASLRSSSMSQSGDLAIASTHRSTCG